MGLCSLLKFSHLPTRLEILILRDFWILGKFCVLLYENSSGRSFGVGLRLSSGRAQQKYES